MEGKGVHVVPTNEVESEGDKADGAACLVHPLVTLFYDDIGELIKPS